MCKMLLSINTQHVDNIFRGVKKYEYRKVKCRSSVESILIYSTFPIMQVVGEARIEAVLEDTPLAIWEQTKQYSGINAKFFRSYYKGKKVAIAYKLMDVREYDEPRTLEEYGVSFAPQSFVYVDD